MELKHGKGRGRHAAGIATITTAEYRELVEAKMAAQEEMHCARSACTREYAEREKMRSQMACDIARLQHDLDDARRELEASRKSAEEHAASMRYYMDRCREAEARESALKQELADARKPSPAGERI